MTSKRVVLRNIRDSGGVRQLEASLSDKGDLVIEGWDFGAGVERVFGEREYEWIWTIRAGDLPILRHALGQDSDLLSALSRRFTGDNAAELKPFLDSHQVPYEIWSRIGD